MIRLLTILITLSLFVSSDLFAQLDMYDDRTDWQNAAFDICYTEDVQGQTDGTRFDQGTPLQLSGFTIEELNSSNNNGSGHVDEQNGNNINLRVRVGGRNDERVEIIFDEPVCGFFADYININEEGPSNPTVMEAYHSNGEMIGMVDLGSGSFSRGVISTDPDMPITRIVMSADDNGTNRFRLDNFEIACCPPAPIPTMGEWAVMILGLCLVIGGVVAVQRRGVPSL